MASNLTFDDLGSGTGYSKPSKPIWAMSLDDKDNEKEVLKWLVGELAHLKQESQERLHNIEKNVALYKGIQYDTQEGNPQVRDRADSRFRNVRKLVVNNFFDFIAHRVSRLVKFKPAVAIIPANNELEDEISAKATKYLLDHIWYKENYEGAVTPLVARDCSVMGESYLWIEWDAEDGDPHPDWISEFKKANGIKGDLTGEQRRQMMQMAQPKIPLMNESGHPTKDSLGNTIYIEKPVNTGDVGYETVLSYDVFLDRKRTWDECDYLFRARHTSVEALRAMFPKKASDIKASREYDIYDFDKMQKMRDEDTATYYEFWHKRTREFPMGRKIVFTQDAILENIKHPYSHGSFPCERATDEDYPGEVHGRASIDNVKGILGLYNNMTNMIVKNQVLASMPKWMMPAGSAKIQSLGNDITIVEYKGPQPPVLVQMNPTPSEVFNFRGMLKDDAQTTYGVFGVSRGETPPGIKSGIALQFLDEQENERFNLSALKFNDFHERVAIKTISLAADMYDASDDRMIKVLGKDNKWMTVAFQTADLHKDYVIRVQKSSALPETKSARIQTVMDLAQSFPGLLANEQIIDMIGLGQAEKFYDMASVSVKAADAENEMMSDDKIVNEPVEYEDHLIHWKTHGLKIRHFSFKNQTPVKVQNKIIDHQRAHEYLMIQHAIKNPAFKEKLMQTDQFPMFLPKELLEPPAPVLPPAPVGGDMGQSVEGLPADPEGLPENPDLGGEPQALSNEPTQSLDVMPQGEPSVPTS